MKTVDLGGSVLRKKFYGRSPDDVAMSLLGKILVRKIGEKVLCGKIVETEAYFGESDPASRAYGKKFQKFYEQMRGGVGKSFVYMVHNNWMFNAVAHEKNDVGAVLIRGVEPLIGWDFMKKHRPVEKIFELTNGPGKLTKAFLITKEHNGIDITDYTNEVFICDGTKEVLEIGTSHRIGVSKDLKKHFRFFVKGNPFVSR